MAVVLRARAEGDSHACAGRQGAPLAAARSWHPARVEALMRAARAAIIDVAALLALALASCAGLPAAARTAGTPSSKRRREPGSTAAAQRERHARCRPVARAAATRSRPASSRRRWHAPRARQRRERASSRPSWRRTPRACRSSCGAGSTSRRSRSCWRGSSCRRARRPCISCGGACCCRRPRRRRARRTPSTSWRLRLEALYRSGLARATWRTVLSDGAAPGPVVADPARPARHRPRPARGRAARRSRRWPRRAPGCPAASRARRSCWPATAPRSPAMRKAPASPPSSRARKASTAELPLGVLAGFAAGTKPQLGSARARAAARLPLPGAAGPGRCRCRSSTRPSRRCSRRWPATPRPDARLQIAAAEAALRLNALPPEAVAEVYRRQSLSGSGAADPTAQPPIRCCGGRCSSGPPRRRGRRRSGRASCAPSSTMRAGRASCLQMARVLAPAARRACAVAGARRGSPRRPWRSRWRPATSSGARRWAETAADLQHWLALIDLADPQRRGGRPPSLAAMEELAPRGRLGADALHRLATVLDALDIDVPIASGMRPAARRNPRRGYLPETGVLADLAQSAKRKDAGRTILLAMRTLGPDGPEGANMLALGDAVRALEAHRPRGRRAPAGARGAVRRLAAHGRPTDGRGPCTTAGDAAQHLEAFLEMLAAERGAADNTLQAYRRDLDDFLRLPRARGPGAAAVGAGRYRRLPARAVRGRPGAGLARAAAVGDPPAVQVPRRRRA